MPRTTATRTLVIAAAVVVVVWGLKQAGALLLPFLFSVFLSVLAAPFVLWLERRRVEPALAVSVTMLGVLGVLVGFGALITTSVAGFEEALPGYRAALDATFDHVMTRLSSYGIDLTEALSRDVIEPGTVVGMASSLMGSLLAALSNTALVVLTMVFILLEIAGFPRKLRAALDDPQADLSELSAIMVDVQRYLAIKTAVSLATGACAAFLLWTVGVDFPILWGIVAFLLNYIPNVGSVIAALPPMAVALVQPGLGPFPMLAVAAGYLAINTIIGNIIEPQLMGRRLGLSPLVVFLSLVFWGWVWGSLGMLLSVPLTIAARIALERSADLRWLAVLLGPSPEYERPPPQPHRWLTRLGVGRSRPVPSEPAPSPHPLAGDPAPTPDAPVGRVLRDHEPPHGPGAP